MALYRKNWGKDPDLYPNTDWQDAVLTGSGFTHSHNVSLSVGSERVRMLTTLGYVDQEGIIKNADFQRYTFRNNADVKFNDKLSMKLDLSFSNDDRKASPYQSTIFNYMNTRPADIPNQFSTGLYNGLGMQGMNPVALMLYGGSNNTNTIRLSGAITLTYEPAKWLSLQGMLAPALYDHQPPQLEEARYDLSGLQRHLHADLRFLCHPHRIGFARFLRQLQLSGYLQAQLQRPRPETDSRRRAQHVRL